MPPLQHRFDVGRESREAVDKVADLGRGDAVLDRQREDVDQLIASMPEKVRADDAIRLFVDQHFRPRGRRRCGPTAIRACR